MGEARQSSPLPQAKGVKGGKRVVERWEKPGSVHPMPRLHIGKVGKGGAKRGESRCPASTNKHTNKKCPPAPREGTFLDQFIISSRKAQALHLVLHNRLFGCHR